MPLSLRLHAVWTDWQMMWNPPPKNKAIIQIKPSYSYSFKILGDSGKKWQLKIIIVGQISWSPWKNKPMLSQVNVWRDSPWQNLLRDEIRPDKTCRLAVGVRAASFCSPSCIDPPTDFTLTLLVWLFTMSTWWLRSQILQQQYPFVHFLKS